MPRSEVLTGPGQKFASSFLLHAHRCSASVTTTSGTKASDEEMGHWTPTGIEPTDYNDDDDDAPVRSSLAAKAQVTNKSSCIYKVTFRTCLLILIGCRAY